MKQLTELDIYILKQEFPQLSLTEDPDIERYFEFRSMNRQSEALRLYNTKLTRRYPDSKIRVLLMTYYRKHDYRFHILLTDSLARLAEATIIQVKKIIVFFTKTITPLKHAKVYTIIQVCEKVISAISPDRFAAIGFTEKYVRYAEKLNYYAEDMRQAADIIRMYITDTISSVREFREERKRAYMQEKNRKAPVSVVDFSKITFTKQQIAAITIPPSVVRVEDKVLAYTMKYWERYTDSAFENTILLYSRKYGTNHYAVFHAVKVGRSRNWKDEELLHAVLANVAQGYYYNITGDLYLQRAWKQLKLKLEALTPQAKALPPPAPAAKKIKHTKNTRKITVNVIIDQTEPSLSKSSSKPAKKSASDLSASVRHGAKPEKPALRQTLKSKPVRNSMNSVSGQPKTARIPIKSMPSKLEPHPPLPNKTTAENKSASTQVYPIVSPKELPASIAGLVKKITGKSYGIYRDLFFKEVRSSIRSILQHSAIQKLSFFGSEQNNAEDIIYQFLENNYDNPYQQWQGSQEQKDVLEQGFRIDSLEPIIRHWAKSNMQ